MFSRGVLPFAVCIGMCTGSSKADFEQDLRSVLSVDDRGFQKKVLSDPMYWVKACTDSQEADKDLQEADKLYEGLREIYEAYEELYEEFCTGVRKIESGFTAKMGSVAKDDPEVRVKRSLYRLELARDLYGEVFNYANLAWYDLVKDENEEWVFEDVNPQILLECFYVFGRRILGLSRKSFQFHVTEMLIWGRFNTKDREPNSKVLEDILKSFAKEGEYKELALGEIGKNDSTLVQKNNIFMKTFLKFSRKNKGTLEEAKNTFGTPSMKSWFEVPEPGKELDYLNYLTMQPWNFIDALRTLSRDASACVTRMTEIKVPAELKKEALPFFKGEKDVGELSEATKIFRMKEKNKRQDAQNNYANLKTDRNELEKQFYRSLDQRRIAREELRTLPESSVEFSNKKDEVEALEKEVEESREQINKLPYFTTKNKHKMQRGAAKEDITKDEHDMAVFANYVRLPGRCDAILDAFLYYQAIMWNVFTDGINVTKGYGLKIYDALKVKEPELTDDFKEEYHTLTKGI